MKPLDSKGEVRPVAGVATVAGKNKTLKGLNFVNPSSDDAKNPPYISINFSGDTDDTGDSVQKTSSSLGDEVSPLAGAEKGQSGDSGDTLDLAVLEVCSLPAHWLAELSLKPTLWLAVPGISAEVVFTASRAQAARAIPGRRAVFTPLEYEAACLAAEHDRARLVDLRRWVERKLADPGWRLTRRTALGAHIPGAKPGGMTLGASLRHLGARVRDVGVGDDPEPIRDGERPTEGQEAA